MAGIVDAHHHFWDPERGDYPWMTEEFGPVRRTFWASDLRPSLEAAGVTRTVVVQTWSSSEETRAFLEIAASTDFVAGVVGWVDLTSPDVADRIAELCAAPGGQYLVGLRHQVHDEPDPEWLLRPDVRRGLAAVEASGLVFDLLVRTRELPAAIATVRAFPRLAFVVDHLAKPPFRSGRLEAWAEAFSAFEGAGNVWAKVSGLVTEADWAAWRRADLQPAIDHAIEVLGPARLMFGSDWPPCLLAATYPEVLATARECLAGLSPDERDLVFRHNAALVYRLPDEPKAGAVGSVRGD